MANLLTLAIGSATSQYEFLTKGDVPIDDGKLRSMVRNAVTEFGYDAIVGNDAQNDSYKRVQDWMVGYLAQYMKMASDGYRVNNKAREAAQDEKDAIDNEGDE